MRRTDRLFDIIQIFRNGKLHRGDELAERLGVSVRTIYRDIETLTASGVPISGERGVGYIMDGPVFLPPLNLTPGELVAMELCLALVRASFGAALEEDAQRLADKIRAVLPRPEMMDPSRSTMGVYHTRYGQKDREALAIIRRAILTKTILAFRYTSLSQDVTQRRVRPLQVQVWNDTLTLTAWCEARDDFRVFRLDLMEQTTLTRDQFQPDKEKSLAAYDRQLAIRSPAYVPKS